MTSITITLISMTILWSAAMKIADAMQQAEKIARNVKETRGNEYKRHLCGSVDAARANLAAAGTLLKQMYPEETETYIEGIDRLSDQLDLTESEFSSEPACVKAGILLHSQSDGITPLGFPNQIYRFSQQEEAINE